MLCAGWAKDIDAVMLTYNVIKYNDTYSKKSGTLWQYYRHELIKDDAGLITHLTAVVNSNALKFKKITGKAANNDIIDIKLPLNHLSNF